MEIAHLDKLIACGKWFVLVQWPHFPPAWSSLHRGEGTGHTCGQAAGQYLQGSQVLGSLGAEALDNPTALHAIKKEEVVVRRVPLRQGLGRKTRQGFSSDALKKKRKRKSPQKPDLLELGSSLQQRLVLLPRGSLAMSKPRPCLSHNHDCHISLHCPQSLVSLDRSFSLSEPHFPRVK